MVEEEEPVLAAEGVKEKDLRSFGWSRPRLFPSLSCEDSQKCVSLDIYAVQIEVGKALTFLIFSARSSSPPRSE